MIYILASLLILPVLWLLVRSQERALDREYRFWLDSNQLPGQGVADRRKRSR